MLYWESSISSTQHSHLTCEYPYFTQFQGRRWRRFVNLYIHKPCCDRLWLTYDSWDLSHWGGTLIHSTQLVPITSHGTREGWRKAEIAAQHVEIIHIPCWNIKMSFSFNSGQHMHILYWAHGVIFVTMFGTHRVDADYFYDAVYFFFTQLLNFCDDGYSCILIRVQGWSLCTL